MFVIPFLVTQIGRSIWTIATAPTRMLREHYVVLLERVPRLTHIADPHGTPRRDSQLIELPLQPRFQGRVNLLSMAFPLDRTCPEGDNQT